AHRRRAPPFGSAIGLGSYTVVDCTHLVLPPSNPSNLAIFSINLAMYGPAGEDPDAEPASRHPGAAGGIQSFGRGRSPVVARTHASPAYPGLYRRIQDRLSRTRSFTHAGCTRSGRRPGQGHAPGISLYHLPESLHDSHRTLP